MDTNYFKLPSNYACLERSNDNVRAYSNDYRTRDTYELINFLWTKTSTQTSVNAMNPNYCLSSDLVYLVPSSISGSVFIGVSIFISILIMGLFNVFKR